MNGRYPTRAAFTMRAMLRPDSKRFLITLAISCLAHGALVLAPAPGGDRKAIRTGSIDRLKIGQSRPLNVTLVRERKPVVSFVVKDKEGEAAVVPPTMRIAPVTTTETPIADANAPSQPTPALPEASQRLAPERNALAPPLPLPAPTFFTTDQLTKRPALLSDPPKLEVTEAMPAFTSGKVVLKVWINEQGAVISVEIEDSDVPDAVAAAATAAFEKLRFEPGEINGRPVATIMRIEVSYDEDMAQP